MVPVSNPKTLIRSSGIDHYLMTTPSQHNDSTMLRINHSFWGFLPVSQQQATNFHSLVHNDLELSKKF